MLSYFPTPYPDEIFYSLIARYFLHIGCSNRPGKAISALFGKKASRAILSFPRNLSHFHQAAGDNLKITVHEIINQFTLFPIYSPYFSNFRKLSVFQGMVNSSTRHTTTLQTKEPYSSLKGPRFCPYCFEEDLATFGEAYWHRSHQIPALSFCTTHSCFLSTVPITHEILSPLFFIPPILEYCPRVVPIQLENPEALIIGKRLLLSFLKSHCPEISPDLYRSILLKSEFRKGKNLIDYSALYNAFTTLYSNDTLQLFLSSVNFADRCWLRFFMRKRLPIMDPIRHILIQGFLSSINLKNTERLMPLQEYQCRNFICKYYNFFNAQCFEQHYSSKGKRMVKTICCSHCGYTYTRSLKKESYQYIFYIKDFGSVWKEKLQDLYRQKLPIRKISQILGCNPQAVKNQIAKLFNNGTSLSEADKKTIQLKEQRTQWIKLKRANVQLTKSQLGYLQPNLLSWLMRNDRLWLDSLSYAKYFKVGSKAIDWKKREKYYIKYIIEVFQQHFLLEEKKRITVSLLLAYIPQKGKISHNLNKMPKLKEYLSSVSETPEEYKLRLLEIVFQNLSNQNVEINRKVLLQESKIRKHHLSSAIEEKIQRLLSKPSNSGLCDNRKTGS